MEESESEQSDRIRITVDENHHLEGTLSLIKEAIDDASELVGKTEENYQNTKSYMVGYRSEIDPSEQYQNELYLREADRNSAQAMIFKQRLEKLLDSPYFARVEFSAYGSAESTVAYIGRFSFTHNCESVISDWLSPVAALFYDFDIGEASYDAPAGTITGSLVGKRQIEIENGQLLYAVDTSASVRDEILQHELSKTSDRSMRTIISSIQREQNKIIRDDRAGTLIIQGVAGSGKTSIALHRIAYLLYRHRATLNSSSIAILSPNKVFSDYISRVLPELGEEPVRELYLRDIYEQILGASFIIENPRSYIDDQDSNWHRRAHYKGSFEFAEKVLDYLDTAPGSLFKGEDLFFGRHRIEASWLEKRFYGYDRLPINERIEMIASEIFTDMSSKTFTMRVPAVPSKRDIRTKLSRMLKAKDECSLYKLFFQESNIPHYLSMPSKRTVEWEDACPLVFFKGVFDGFETFSEIKHLVMDEMQDLTPLQHNMMDHLFECEKTILGDYHQMVDPSNAMSLERMQSIYTNSRVVKLVRSYRSTIEIAQLAGHVKQIPELESVVRHGEAPRFIACTDTNGILKNIDELIRSFHEGGYRTLGILHKSDEIAKRYYRLIASTHDVQLISSESSSFENGISVSSIRMAKGLEFDEVIILDADKTQYSHAVYDRDLLYVAITRAMHKLTILYRQEVSTLFN